MGQIGCCTRPQANDHALPFRLDNKAGALEADKCKAKERAATHSPTGDGDLIPTIVDRTILQQSLKSLDPTPEADRANKHVPLNSIKVSRTTYAAAINRGCSQRHTTNLIEGKAQVFVVDNPEQADKAEPNCFKEPQWSTTINNSGSPQRNTGTHLLAVPQRLSVCGSTTIKSESRPRHRGKPLKSSEFELVRIIPKLTNRHSEKPETCLSVHRRSDTLLNIVQFNRPGFLPSTSARRPQWEEKQTSSHGRSGIRLPSATPVNSLPATPQVSHRISSRLPATIRHMANLLDHSSGYYDHLSVSLTPKAIEPFVQRAGLSPVQSDQIPGKHSDITVRKSSDAGHPPKEISPVRISVAVSPAQNTQKQQPTKNDSLAVIFHAKNCPFLGLRKQSLRPILTANSTFRLSSVEFV